MDVGRGFLRIGFFRNSVFYEFDCLGNVIYDIERLIAVSTGKVAGLDGIESGIGRDLVRFATVGAYEHLDILPQSKKAGGGNLPLCVNR